MRESFVFFKSFFEAIEEIPAKYQPDIYAAVCRYSLYGEIPELTGVAKALFILMKANLDASEKKYIAAIENGKKGGRPKKDTERSEETEENHTETEIKPGCNPIETQEKTNENPTVTETKPNDNLNENDNVTVTDALNDNEDVTVASTSASAVKAAPAVFSEADFREEEEEEETKTAQKIKGEEEKPVESLPLLNGREYPVFRCDIEKWEPSYPGIDVETELHRMKAWLDANPKKRKAPMDIQRFIAGWLNREHKEVKTNPSYSVSKKPAAAQTNPLGFDLDEFCNNAIARSMEIADELERERKERESKKLKI